MREKLMHGYHMQQDWSGFRAVKSNIIPTSYFIPGKVQTIQSLWDFQSDITAIWPISIGRGETVRLGPTLQARTNRTGIRLTKFTDLWPIYLYL